MKEKNIYNPDTKIVNCPTCGSECNQSTGGVTNYFSPLQKENIEVKETQEDIWWQVFSDCQMNHSDTFTKIMKSKFTITRK